MIEGKKELSGEDAFKLYDTYGFPIELTVEICADNGVEVDIKKFKECLEKQKELARNSRKNIESFNKQSKDLLDFDKESEFIYQVEDLNAKVIGLFKDGVAVESLSDEGDVVFDKTNFYAEMGGQVADIGFISNPNINFGTISLGDEMALSIDKPRRLAIMRNHSATHLLQSALIKHVGDDVRQKGSFVNDEYLRFDFSHFEKIDQVTLNEVEKEVNNYISMMIENNTLILPIEEAKKLGALAEFDAKYGDKVRVVCFGDTSKEFCGGTHVKNSADIGLFVIKSEESISAGVRRIEATTGLNAYLYMKQKEEVLNQTRNLISVKSNQEVISKLNAINTQIKDLEEEVKTLNQQINKAKFANIASLIKNKDELTFIAKVLENTSRNGLISILDDIKSKTSNYLVVLVGSEEGKHPIIVGVGKELLEKGYKAGDVLKIVTSKFGGNGGGKPDRAQGNLVSIDNFDIKEEDIIN